MQRQICTERRWDKNTPKEKRAMATWRWKQRLDLRCQRKARDSEPPELWERPRAHSPSQPAEEPILLTPHLSWTSNLWNCEQQISVCRPQWVVLYYSGPTKLTRLRCFLFTMQSAWCEQKIENADLISPWLRTGGVWTWPGVGHGPAPRSRNAA